MLAIPSGHLVPSGSGHASASSVLARPVVEARSRTGFGVIGLGPLGPLLDTCTVRADEWDVDAYLDGSDFQVGEGEGLLDLLRPQPGERIVDIGCGDGRLTAAIAATGARVVGLDPSLAMVSTACRRGQAVVVGRAEALPFADNSLGAVFSNAALHWSRDHRRCLEEMARVLGPSGRLVVRVGGPGNQWRVFSEAERLFAEAPYVQHRPPGFAAPLRMADPPAWMAHLVDLGFQVERFDVEATGPGWETVDEIVAWFRPIARPYTSLLPNELREPFVAEVVRRAAPMIDPHRCFVRLVITARVGDGGRRAHPDGGIS